MAFVSSVSLLSMAQCYGEIVTFEELTLANNSFYNGNRGVSNSDGWSSRNVFFNNTYDTTFGGFWSGWSYSNVVNTTTPGFNNQYASWPGGGSNGVGGSIPGNHYAIAFAGTPNQAYFNLPTGAQLQSVDLANTTYAALSMRDGDPFSKKFGGVSGNDPDFFRVTLTGFSNSHGAGSVVGTVTVDLADFTFANNQQDSILSTWRSISLQPIANASSVGISFSSSDVGPFGINTPTYLALDNLAFTAVPEPNSAWLLTFATLGCLAIFMTKYRVRRDHVHR